jgi:hypothetical protein
MQVIAASKSDYANIHWYEPINGKDTAKYQLSGLLPSLAAYLQQRTGKPLISNEFGTRNFSASLLTDLLNQQKNLAFPIQIYYAGDNSSLAINLEPVFSQFLKAK